MANGTEIRALELGEQIAQKQNVYIVDVTYKKADDTYSLCYYIDKEGGIGIDECELFSKAVEELLDAEDFIEEKSEKYDAPIAQGGTNVSGGQKQRLAIARAIAKHPKIFVFDDSFSALDLKTDAKLRKALSNTVQDSTVIIVAQRISTILHADQILVLDEGQIVGKGTHEELMKTCTVYQEIAKSQMSAKELGLTDGEEAEDHE